MTFLLCALPGAVPLALAGVPQEAAVSSSTAGSVPRGAIDESSAPTSPARSAEPVVDPALYGGLRYRSVGPHRGGRVTAVDGVPGQPFTFFFGSTGGGVWRTDNAGHTWRNVTDGFLAAGSIGAVEVADADPNVLYVGTGSACIRGNVSTGVGVYRSTDGGRSWSFAGLPDAGQIGRIVTHPRDPERVWVAALGSAFGASEERGVYRSIDGGGTWERVLYVSDQVGAVDLVMSPGNPRVLFAAMWRGERKPWTMISGSEDGGLFRSSDGGDSWQRVEGGFPQGLVGRIGVAVSPADTRRVWAIVEADEGRSALYRSNDGGATVSVDGGASWSHQLNQPTAELYSLTVDDGFPYRLYGPQQDNSTISVPSMATYSGISLQHWLAVGGCETGPIAIKPGDPDVVYSGCFGGRLARFDRRAEQFRQIRDDPENMAGMPESELRYRIQWNAPITTSRHDPDVLYHGSQHVHRSTDEGQSWQVISPDLTGRHTEMFGPAGGPITHDITGVEIYSALLAIEEDVHDPETIWTGSNDGVVSVSRDGGASWNDVTPGDVPELTTINRIEPSPHRAGKAYVTAYRYRMDDWRPYVWRTEDFGATWERIADGTRGIPADWPTRVVREDPDRPGLLYAGTEFGVLVSFDDGGRWQSLQQNLPRTPVTDLRVHRQDLVVATQGRSFWILDDVTPLHQLGAEIEAGGPWLFNPRAAVRTSAETSDRDYERDRVHGAMLPRDWLGENPPDGAIIHYLAGHGEEPLGLEILEPDGDPVRRYRSDASGAEQLPAGRGLQRFVWDLTYPGPDLGRFSPDGPRAVPGSYTLRLSRGDWSQERTLELRKDPRLTHVSVLDLQAQFDFLSRVQSDLERIQDAVATIDDVRRQLRSLVDRLGDRDGAATRDAPTSAPRGAGRTVSPGSSEPHARSWVTQSVPVHRIPVATTVSAVDPPSGRLP